MHKWCTDTAARAGHTRAEHPQVRAKLQVRCREPAHSSQDCRTRGAARYPIFVAGFDERESPGQMTSDLGFSSSPDGIRTRATALRGQPIKHANTQFRAHSQSDQQTFSHYSATGA